MKRLVVLVPILILLLLLTFSGLAMALTPQGAMMQALKTGNYSTVKPYFSPLMKTIFSKGLFTTVRKGLVRRYGEIKGYKVIREDREDGSTIYYYRVIAERGNYTVSVTIKDGKIEGFHTKELPFFITWRGLFYPLMGAFVGLLLLWAYLRKFHGAELILGAVLLVPVIIFQPIIQAVPKLLGFHSLYLLIPWIGLIAALFQEPLKYIVSRGKTLGKALYIGIGFGIGEGVYVALISTLLGGASWLALFERSLTLLFHASTTVLFAYSYMRGWGRKALLAMIGVHWLIDSTAAYWHINPTVTILVVSYVPMLVVSLVVLPKLLPTAKAEEEKPAVRW